MSSSGKTLWYRRRRCSGYEMSDKVVVKVKGERVSTLRMVIALILLRIALWIAGKRLDVE